MFPCVFKPRPTIFSAAAAAAETDKGSENAGSLYRALGLFPFFLLKMSQDGRDGCRFGIAHFPKRSNHSI